MTRVTREIKGRVNAEINRCIAIAEKHYDRSFKFPTVVYKKRGTTAGTACDLTYTIDLNSVLLMENGDDFIGTVTHEFAHLVDGIVNPHTRDGGIRYDRFGRTCRGKRSVHGPSWKRIMRLFGVRNPTRCHSYNVSNARVKRSRKHVWVCGCGNGRVVLTNLKHNRQLRLASSGYGMYSRGHTPRRCGVYTYKGIEGTATPKPFRDRYPTPKPKTSTKLAHAVKIVRDNPELSRVKLIALIQVACGMSTAGATTYYYNAKKA
ncbi:hypothetical protein LCGC14_1927450 [marine sediment metagenome]|uniref:SprT-like domain-containing protein n=1 Tax=marine sediment metagenome TaxID=412755 RepID=A0A0F9FPK7_9ZZZZ